MALKKYLPKPRWLRIKLPTQKDFGQTRKLLRDLNLNTVCQSARCPNIFECFCKHTATFLILGKYCTRSCTFCNIEHKDPEPVDAKEPERIAEAVKRLGLKYVVITSVTRDDLLDGGALHFARVINLLKENPELKVEVLIPDFQGSKEALSLVLAAKPYVLNHNLETVPSLYPKVRPQADYKRSLQVLKWSKELAQGEVITKSGLMLGLGEEEREVLQVLEDLKAVNCDWVTLGQYLQPSKKHFPVQEYVSLEKFKYYQEKGESLGLKVFAGPLVRSSYNAEVLNK